ncbi:MAG TPA: hypothetical protein VLR92_07090, partial [Blastocatellia bacterium]|nr:hypothetical protein [Blastocatellia bacterium]
YLLDRLKDVQPSETPHEFAFPRFLPTSDTRHGLDFYRELTHTFAGEIKNAGIGRPEATPATERLAKLAWSEPTLLEEELGFGPRKRKVRVRIGFPCFLGNDDAWACSFQLKGLGSGAIQRVRGENGLLAVARATKVIRESFDVLEPQSLGTYYELTFPAYLPTSHGLELHQRLRKLLDVERARRLRRLLRNHDVKRQRELQQVVQERGGKVSGVN